MPGLTSNKNVWDGTYDWEQAGGEWGEEWSIPWGGSYPEWVSTLMPRIGLFLPAHSILEIAPGYGRWSRFLIPMSTKYWGVDIAGKCIEHCKTRFKADSHANFFQNDGVSLDMIGNDSIDFCFSFDSLVHAEIDVMEQYLPQIIAKLKKDGVVFLHHSNFEEYYQNNIPNKHWRARSVSGERVRNIIEKNCGKVIVQEKVNWNESSQNLIDCFTLFCRNDSERFLSTEPKFITNNNFDHETSYSKTIFSNYNLASSAK